MNIVVTNDDGIWSIGLRTLANTLRDRGHKVEVIAPLTEQSAVGHAVTISSPLRIKDVRDNDFQGIGVSGTPVDCVKLALTTILKEPPDLFLSGINSGANVGVDVLYSGTVAAATEAALAKIPSMAISIDDFSPTELYHQAEFISRLVERINWKRYQGYVINLNFPRCNFDDIKGIRVCPQTQAVYKDWYEEREDPRGRKYYWLCGYIPPEQVQGGTDRDLLSKGFITITPLAFNFTAFNLLSCLQEELPSLTD